MKKVLYILTLILALAACKKQPVLDVDKATITVEAAGSTEEVTVSANYPWTASASDSWIRVKYTEGENILKITISQNTNTDGRQGTVTLKSEELSKTISITQKQRDAIELDTAGRLSIDSDAQQIGIDLKSNVDLTATVTEGSDWVSVVSVKSMTAHTVTLNVKANEQRTMRRAIVSFSDKSGTVSQQVMIDQDGKPQMLNVGFEGVTTFRVPLLEAVTGAVMSAMVFWDNETEGTTYTKTLTKDFGGSAGTLRIEAHNAEAVSFSDVNGLTLIDLSDF